MKEKMKKLTKVFLPALIVSLMSIAPAFALEGTGAPAAMETAFDPIKTEFFDAIAKVAPIAIAIVAAPMIWKLGIKFFKSLTNK